MQTKADSRISKAARVAANKAAASRSLTSRPSSRTRSPVRADSKADRAARRSNASLRIKDPRFRPVVFICRIVCLQEAMHSFLPNSVMQFLRDEYRLFDVRSSTLALRCDLNLEVTR